ncbi:MAG: hypothetical protein AB7F94_17420 [Nitrospira sp.]
MDQRHSHKARYEASRTCSKLLRWWFCTTSTNGLLLAGTPDKMPFDAGQLSHAGTDHATAVEVEQVLRHLSHGQVLATE